MSQQINLFSPVFLRQEKYFSAKAMAQAFGLICVGLMAFYGYARYETNALERVAESMAQQQQRSRDQLTALVLRTSAGTSQLLASESSRLEKRRDGQRAILATLQAAEFGSNTGFAPYFEAFARRSIQGLWLTGFSVGGGGNDLAIVGRATSAGLLPKYLDGLNDEEVMRGRKVVEMKVVAKEEKPSAFSGVAREEKPPAPAAEAAPLRYVEFTIAAPRVIATPAANSASSPGASGSKP